MISIIFVGVLSASYGVSFRVEHLRLWLVCGTLGVLSADAML